MRTFWPKGKDTSNENEDGLEIETIPASVLILGEEARARGLTPPGVENVTNLAQEDPKERPMSLDITGLREIAGFLGACVADSENGLMLAQEGGGDAIDLEVAGAMNTEVVKAKLRAMDALGLDDKIEDILITLGTQYHLIRPLEQNPSVFIYVALSKAAANLGMARIQVKKIESTLSV